jgi:hypothetical protein
VQPIPNRLDIAMKGAEHPLVLAHRRPVLLLLLLLVLETETPEGVNSSSTSTSTSRKRSHERATIPRMATGSAAAHTAAVTGFTPPPVDPRYTFLLPPEESGPGTTGLEAGKVHAFIQYPRA